MNKTSELIKLLQCGNNGKPFLFPSEIHQKHRDISVLLKNGQCIVAAGDVAVITGFNGQLIDFSAWTKHDPKSMSQEMSLLTSSRTVEWYTPPHLIDMVKRVLGHIDLDPASCLEANQFVQAVRIFTKQMNALDLEWHATSVWLNSPFNKYKGKSMQDLLNSKMHEEYGLGHFERGISIIKSVPGYAWYEKAIRYPVARCFVESRIHFIPKGSSEPGKPAKAGSTLLYWGPDPKLFQDVFEEIGRVEILGD